MQTRQQKEEFVKESIKEVAKHNVVAVLPLNNVPDRLVQASRNKMRQKTKFIVAKKSLITRILEGNEKTKPLTKHLAGMTAIVLSDDDPFTLYSDFKSNSIRLAAKPNQVAPEDINVAGGETTIQPGQAVTELKQAGIDVQIQKGKVVIAKDKVLVKKGAVISAAVAKALKTLDIIPFTASIEPTVIVAGNLQFTKDILSITQEQVLNELGLGFASALTVCMERKIVNSYTISNFIGVAYREAMALGTSAKVYEPGIVDRLIASAVGEAKALDAKAK